MDDLKSLINHSGYKLSYIASELGISRYSLTNKLNNVTEFKMSEMKKLCDILKIDQQAIGKIFFKEQ